LRVRHHRAEIRLDVGSERSNENAVATGSELASLGLHARNFEAESAHRITELEANPEIAFEKDFLRWMLSDGAGAFLLEDKPLRQGISLAIDWIHILSQADSMQACMYAGAEKLDNGKLKAGRNFTGRVGNRSIFTVKQDVRLLNEAVAYQTIGKSLEKLMATSHLVAEDIDWFLPHMSSEYFASRWPTAWRPSAFPSLKKMVLNLRTKGNTGSASIYIMVDELPSGRLKLATACSVSSRKAAASPAR
jgi:3-oxoacyl-[acyl-carrier-protein] synthase-3